MARFAPTRRALPYAQEMWALYERGELTPDSKLTGRYQVAERKVSTEAVLGLIGDATRDERRRREHLGLSMRGAAEEAVEAESAPRPVSRYAQKREEKVAARKLEALNKPPVQRAGPRDGHGHAAHEKPRPRTGEQARGHTQRVTPGDGHGHAAHEKPRPRAGEQARGHTQRVTPGDGHGHAAHEKPRPRTGEQARGATQRATGAHEPPRARHANAAHAARGNAGGDAPRDAGRRTASAQDRGHAAAKPAPQRPAHPKLDHGRQQAASGANANSAEAAPKRRRRRRKRKPGEGAPSGPGR
jgi:RIO kinase 1